MWLTRRATRSLLEKEGIFVCRRPFPGLTQTLWGADERYAEEYWNQIPNCYYTGDAAKKDEDGYIWFIARADEVIKIAGHRIGTVEVESAFLSHPAVAEAAVIGEPDPLRGEVAAAFVVLKKGHAPSDQLKEELKKTVREIMGPVVVLGRISFVEKIPKTRSGKIMRRLVKAVITGQAAGGLLDHRGRDRHRRDQEGRGGPTNGILGFLTCHRKTCIA
jgi:acetyl-CoA synthetase